MLFRVNPGHGEFCFSSRYMDAQDKAKPRQVFGAITNTLQSVTPKEVSAKEKLTKKQLEARRMQRKFQ
ncbi:hypothetical protein ACP70R_004456 [Stipagrostis hirtigluma subsp. patula]